MHLGFFSKKRAWGLVAQGGGTSYDEVVEAPRMDLADPGRQADKRVLFIRLGMPHIHSQVPPQLHRLVEGAPFFRPGRDVPSQTHWIRSQGLAYLMRPTARTLAMISRWPSPSPLTHTSKTPRSRPFLARMIFLTQSVVSGWPPSHFLLTYTPPHPESHSRYYSTWCNRPGTEAVGDAQVAP